MPFQQHEQFDRRDVSSSPTTSSTKLTLTIILLFMYLESTNAFTQLQFTSNKKTPMFISLTTRSFSENNICINTIIKQETCSSMTFTSSSLSMAWTDPSSFSMKSFASPLRSFGGWYNEVDATPRTIVYDDDNSFGFFADEWPTMSSSSDLFSSEPSQPAEKTLCSKPLRRFKGLAYRAITCLPRFRHRTN